jgi:hypothetical protein
MMIVAAAPIRVGMSRIFKAALVYANVSPADIISRDPIKVSCQSIAIASPRIPLASRASPTDSEHGKGQLPLYVTLGLAARKALPGSRAAERDIDSSTRGIDGYTFLFLHYAQSAAETRMPGGSAAGNPDAGFSCLTARTSTAQISARPTLLPALMCARWKATARSAKCSFFSAATTAAG